MRSNKKKSGSSALVVTKAKRIAKRAATRGNVKRVASRTKRFVESTPARIILGASAIAFAFVLAKLKHLV
jgi:hypothetical protein